MICIIQKVREKSHKYKNIKSALFTNETYLYSFIFSLIVSIFLGHFYQSNDQMLLEISKNILTFQKNKIITVIFQLIVLENQIPVRLNLLNGHPGRSFSAAKKITRS